MGRRIAHEFFAIPLIHGAMSVRSFHLVRDVLDREIVDVDGTPCGVADDVLIAREKDGTLRIDALLLGPAAWAPRLPGPLRWLIRRLAKRPAQTVPWKRVARIDERVVLDAPASELGLDRIDRAWSRWMRRIPGA